MTGVTALGIAKPFCASQLLSALESDAWSCTVSYGPTFCCFVTVTVPPPEEPGDSLAPFDDGPPKPFEQLLGGLGHVTFGAVIWVAVSSSIESKRTSALRPTVTVP